MVLLKLEEFALNILLSTLEESYLVSLFLLQVLLVDLRCHGDSASITTRGPHTVASTALDVLKLVRNFQSFVYFKHCCLFFSLF